ncbi:MAG: adenylate/guanylate cyclase domain-containing protein, partial [Alphaproteobacteria bacterium]|nr:adenylate/guanylate cyclase domain-containing protein [Alphaproteobacteria bacterium]
MASDRVERRLAAVLAADMVGYSRLMEADEAATLVRQKAHRQELIDPKIAEYRGRIVKTTGDGVLVEFASVVDATECAVAIQRAMAEREAGVPEERRIRYRVGVNLGDIVIDGDDIFGDGVNVAARLEGLAEPGGICIPRKVFHEVRNKLDVGYAFVGEQKVKNMENPVPVYRVLLEPAAAGQVVGEKRPGRPRWQLGAAVAAVLVGVASAAVWWQPWVERVEPASVERMTFPLPEKPSIAVLPFDNLSGDPTQAYWVDGTTEAVITALSKTPNLFVIARSTTFAYKGKPAKARSIAEEFGVRFVLSGGIQRDGDRVRVSAQLVDALSGHHVWAEQYDRRFEDLFALQDDITREVVTALEVELTEGEQARIWRRQTNDQRAYELFRDGLVLYRRRTNTDNAEARKLFVEAVAIDPDFADAKCLIGFTYLRAGLNGWERPRGDAFGKGRELAAAALVLDPDYAHAYALLATITLYEGDPDEAIAQYQTSLELEPNYSANVAGYADALVYAGRGAEAVEEIERAMRLSPYYPNFYLAVAGAAYR